MKKCNEYKMNLVKEHINEINKFQRGLDPKEAMDIGLFKKIKKGDHFFVKRYSTDSMEKNTIALEDEKETETYERYVKILNWFATFDKNKNCWFWGDYREYKK